MSVGTTLDIPVTADPSWRDATVTARRVVVDHLREIELAVEGWPGHRAGQYVDVRFPTPEGWSRRHSFSIAGPAESPAAARARIRIVARVDVVEAVEEGTRVLVDGPKGDRLAWTPESTGTRPLLLIAGGTGIVPLLAIARVWAAGPRTGALQLIHSVRSLDRQPYADELAALAETPGAGVTTIVTGAGEPARDARGTGPRRTGRRSTGRRNTGRLGALDLELFGVPVDRDPECFVCGPVPFVESVTRMLVQSRYPAVRIRTEWAVSVEDGDPS